MLDQVVSYFWYLVSSWWFWILFLVGIFLYWGLFRQRSYKAVDRKAWIRHGRLGKWENLDEHLERGHPVEWTILHKIDKEDKDAKGS